MPKPEPIEIDDRDRRYMYRARVLVGDLPIVTLGPLLGPLDGFDSGEGGSGSIVDINGGSWAGECGVGSAAEVLLEEVVEEMVEEVCFDVCFQEDAPSVWEYHRRVA